MTSWAEVMERIVRERRHALVGYAFLVSGSMSEAEEIAQDAIVKTFARGRAKREVETAEAYIKRAIVNETINRARHRKVAAARSAALAAAESEPGHETWVGVHADIHKALAGLSAQERACVVMRYFEDMTVAQIADELRLSAGTVKRYLHNAAEKLRDTLGSTMADPEPRELIRVAVKDGGTR